MKVLQFLLANYRERFVDDIVKVFGVREELRLTARVDGYVVLAASGYEPPYVASYFYHGCQKCFAANLLFLQ